MKKQTMRVFGWSFSYLATLKPCASLGPFCRNGGAYPRFSNLSGFRSYPVGCTPVPRKINEVDPWDTGFLQKKTDPNESIQKNRLSEAATAGVIPWFGCFHLNDLRTHVSHQHCCRRSWALELHNQPTGEMCEFLWIHKLFCNSSQTSKPQLFQTCL